MMSLVTSSSLLVSVPHLPAIWWENPSCTEKWAPLYLRTTHVRARTTSRTHYIRVKADPGADANLMPLHHFRAIFPYLCDKNGKPKEGVLEKAESSFESYSGDNVSVIGQTKIYAKNKQTQQFMMTRIFVISKERGPILLGNAACQWLGLIAVLVENKAPVVGSFMAAVTREKTECGEVEAYPLPKTGDGAEMTKPTSKPRLAIEAPKKKRKRTKKAKIGGKCFRTFGRHSGEHSQQVSTICT